MPLTPATIRALALVALMAGPASGAAEDDRARAARHYQRGVTEYNLGRFDSAIAELSKAYELDPAPILLFNIAQAHWKAGTLEKAVFFYRRFLATSPPATGPEDQRRLEDVRRRVEELDARLARQAQAPPEPARAPASPPVRVSPPGASDPPAPATAAPPDRPMPRLEFSLSAGAAVPRFSGDRDLPAPAVPAGALAAFYRITSRPALALGLVLVESRLPYPVANRASEAASHFPGLLAGAQLAAALGGPLELAAQIAAGVLWWQGLVAGNPFSLDGAEATGMVPMPAARLALSLRGRLSPASFLALTPSYVVSKPTSGLSRAVSTLGFVAIMLEAGVRL
jgi:tetratricopeptide (TPR) repeat protein